MDLEKYLARINITKIEPPSLAYLTRLMENHLIIVPFENLDILLGRDISLDRERIYQKVVERKRGGYCYELNGLFSWALQELGFKVDLISAQVFREKTGLYSPEFAHLALMVQLDRPYLVDVGFGGESFRRPMLFPGGEMEDVGGRRRLRRIDYDEDRHVVEFMEGVNPRPQYSFTPQPRVMSDFQEMNVVHQTAKESRFTKGVICGLALENGWMMLRGNILKIVENGNTECVNLPSAELRDRFIVSHFGIRLE